MHTIVCIPCQDQMDTVFVKSLIGLSLVGDVSFHFMSSSLIYKSRNDLAEFAVKADSDLVLWLDSDMVFPASTLKRLIEDLEGRDIVCGLFHMRRPPFKPALFKTLRQGTTPAENESADYDDHPDNEIFEVEGCGFACVLMRTKVLKDIIEKYGDAFSPLPGYGEDLSACIRARGCGYKIHCDPRLEIGHRAETIVTSQTFRAYKAAHPDGEKN